jgi:hypothetical protein
MSLQHPHMQGNSCNWCDWISQSSC